MAFFLGGLKHLYNAKAELLILLECNLDLLFRLGSFSTRSLLRRLRVSLSFHFLSTKTILLDVGCNSRQKTYEEVIACLDAQLLGLFAALGNFLIDLLLVLLKLKICLHNVDVRGLEEAANFAHVCWPND